MSPGLRCPHLRMPQVSPPDGAATPPERVIRRAHELGIRVIVWTVDDPAAMRALLDMGVDGIITDRPDLLREVLISRGEWPRASGVRPATPAPASAG